MTPRPVRTENRLLSALPPAEGERIRNLTDVVRFTLRGEVYRAGGPVWYVYFPRAGVFSLVAEMGDGRGVEVGAVGREGVVGLPAFHGHGTSTLRVVCQIAPAEARRMRADVFRREADRPGPFRGLVHQWARWQLDQVALTAACGHLHGVDARCARWLAATRDRAGADEFRLTQEFLALMLGVARPTVSQTAGQLQAAGLIRYRHGRVTVLDPARLEAAACECYHVLRASAADLYAAPRSVPSAFPQLAGSVGEVTDFVPGRA